MKKKNPNPNANDEARIRTRALNPFGTLAERLALIDDTVRYCHAAAATAGGDAILLSTWPDSGRIVLSQARPRPRLPPPSLPDTTTTPSRLLAVYNSPMPPVVKLLK